MRIQDFAFFKDWFNDYCKRFYSPNKEDQKNIILKEEHTFRVCENAHAIIEGLSLDRNLALLSETAALFHDIGRFPQYEKFKTFRDNISVNHGALGAEVLEKENVLKGLSEKEHNMIIQAVRFHNAFTVPNLDDEASLLILKIVRDADKLDIWNVFLEYYSLPPDERASAVGLGLPDSSEYSEKLVSQLYEKRLASLFDVKTLTDFKLLQLSWIFDLNFEISFRLFLRRNYLQRLAATLPDNEEIHGVISFLHKYVNERANT